MKSTSSRYDVVIVGGGHNGLVAAGYLAKAAQKVAILESRSILGGPVGTYEFMPGYRIAFTNSPGSLESGIVKDLELEAHGLRFVRPDPTLVHHFPDRPFIGWRDREAVKRQLDVYAQGEGARYGSLLTDIEEMARHLGISVYEPAPDLSAARRRVHGEQRELFDAVFFGSLRDLLDARLASTEAKALLGMVALNTTLARTSTKGSAVGLIMRPLSMMSGRPGGADDLRGSALRGSTGLPVGGMGAITDALESFCVGQGVDIYRNARVARVSRCGDALVVATAEGMEVSASRVVAATNPQTAISFLEPDVVPDELVKGVATLPMTGSACKLVLALDRIPSYAGLPNNLSNEAAARTQFRIGPSLDYMEQQIDAVEAGTLPDRPLVWGLIPSLTSPCVAPKGRHLLSANVWHAPYDLSEGDWGTLKDEFAHRAIDAISDLMPDLKDCVVDCAVMSPPEIEAELGLVRSHITHGDMLTETLFGPRPHALANDYRTPLRGFYLSGSGTWPGGYVTGIPGLNASRAVLSDIQNER